MKQSRSIDLAKFIGALLIIIIHTDPFSSYSGVVTFGLRNCIATVAVPFFFITSGYLYSKKQTTLLTNQDKNAHFIKWLTRVLIMYLFWSAVYFVFVVIKWFIQGFTFNLVLIYIKDFFLNGSYSTIWYLLATLTGGLLMGLMRKKLSYKNIIIIASILYIFTLLASAYYNFSLKIPVLSSIIKGYYVVFDNVKNGLLFGLIFMSIGGWFGEREQPIKISKITNLILMAIFWVLMAVEQFAIYHFNLFKSTDTVLFLVPLSFLIFNFVLSIELKDSPIYKKLRTLSILMFLTQRIPITIIELWLSNTILYTNSLVFFVTILVSTTLISILIDKLVSKIKFLKKVY